MTPRLAVLPAALLAAACVANIGQPQTRDEYVAMMKPGGTFRNVEQTSVARPFKTVVADLTEYANKCLKIKTSRAPNAATRETGTNTTYNPKLELVGGNAAALSLQEEYGVTGSASGTKHANSGLPPGGLYVLVAEMRSAASNRTDLSIYYTTGRAAFSDMLKKWAAGDKGRCPIK